MCFLKIKIKSRPTISSPAGVLLACVNNLIKFNNKKRKKLSKNDK